MTILITGAAGFIGYHMAAALLARSETVVGVDTLNDYYDVTLKQARRDRLSQSSGFTFERLDIAEPTAVAELFSRHPEITLRDMYRGVVPFIILHFAVLGLIIAFPSVALWLPSALLGFD